MTNFDRRDKADIITRLDSARSRSVSAPMPDHHRNTVLLIEDHLEVRTVLARALRKAELEVLEAADAIGARQALDSAQVDAVVTDIALPGGINGVELGRWIRFRFPSMPLVFITGLTQSEMPGRPVQDGRTRMVNKPFAASLLVQHVRSLLSVTQSVAPP